PPTEHAREADVPVGSVFPLEEPLAELHAHLGGGFDAASMWELAHEQGIKVPYRDYWEFADATSVGLGTDGLDGLNRIYGLTELIQSSPDGVEVSVHGMIGGAYRSQRITTHEVRFNPAKRNRGGERDLDAIVMAAAHGVDRATLEYPVRAGLILMMDRSFSAELNEAVVERAIRFRDRGVVAIDIGGPRPRGAPAPYPYRDLAPLVARARDAGLGVTLHAGEEGVNAPDPSPYVDEMHQVIDLGVDRIGHGIIAAYEPALAARLAEGGIVLEVCPTSNLKTGAVRDEEQMAEIVYSLRASGVEVAIGTDGPEMIGTRLRAEYAFLVRRGAVSPGEAAEMNEAGHRASFLASDERSGGAG
ncbi:MAG: adenosine deaminase family protein, partial [Miltoncostaeaceae bacterium]